LLDYFAEYFRILGREYRQNLAVKRDSLLLERRDEFAVGETVGPGSCPNPCLPERAESALSVFAADVGMRPRVQQRLAREALFGFASPLKALGVFEEFFSVFVCRDAAFDSNHT